MQAKNYGSSRALVEKDLGLIEQLRSRVPLEARHGSIALKHEICPSSYSCTCKQHLRVKPH